jgi:hypothetical protein
MNLKNLNNREKQAIGAISILYFCEKYSVYDKSLCELINHLFNILIVDDLTKWESDGLTIEIIGRGEPLPKKIEEIIPFDIRDDFQRLIDDAVEIGIVDLYGEDTFEPDYFTQQCLKILTKHHIEVLFPADFFSNTSNSTWEKVWDFDKYKKFQMFYIEKLDKHC